MAIELAKGKKPKGDTTVKTAEGAAPSTLLDPSP